MGWWFCGLMDGGRMADISGSGSRRKMNNFIQCWGLCHSCAALRVLVRMRLAGRSPYHASSPFCWGGNVLRLANGTRPISASVSTLPSGPKFVWCSLPVDHCSITLSGRDGDGEVVCILMLSDGAEVTTLWSLRYDSGRA